MQQSTALPVLQMIPSELLVPHEDYDPRRVDRLSRRLLEEGFLKNPPVVAEIPADERFVVMDGANRSNAFKAAGIPHIVAQVVSYDDPGVILDTWYHVVSGMEVSRLEQALAKVPFMSLQDCCQDDARQQLESGKALAYIVSEQGVRTVQPVGDTPVPTLDVIHAIVGTYRGIADIFRASNDIWEIQKPFYPDITALIVFSRLKPEDLIEAARNGDKVPSGITRHIIPARALNINIPIGILMADWSLDRKRSWLDDWWMDRMAANAIRYYAESTFSFNE
jgi:hypothetical protein